MKESGAEEISVVQRTRDLILWVVPTVNKFPRDFKHAVGLRLVDDLYSVLETLVEAKVSNPKAPLLDRANVRLDLVRNHLRLILDFKLIDGRKYLHASELVHAIGVEIGGWRKRQKNEEARKSLVESD